MLHELLVETHDKSYFCGSKIYYTIWKFGTTKSHWVLTAITIPKSQNNRQLTVFCGAKGTRANCITNSDKWVQRVVQHNPNQQSTI
jgi:hypothetical protein